MKSATKVLVSCSNRILTEAIARMLSKKCEFDVISAKTSAFEDVGGTISDADVVVLDSLDMYVVPSGTDAEATSGGKPSCVLVAMEDNHAHFLKAIQGGVRGYVLRDASALEVIGAIRSVAQGQAACPPSYTRVLFDYVAASVKAPSQTVTATWELTRREQQLIPLISRGLTNKEIANTLNLSEQTVKNHIHRMMRKMRSSSRLDVCNAWTRQSSSASTNFIGYSSNQEPA